MKSIGNNDMPGFMELHTSDSDENKYGISIKITVKDMMMPRRMKVIVA